MTYCSPTCPGFDGHYPGDPAPAHRCTLCEGSIFPGEFYYTGRELLLCKSCLQSLDLWDLIAFLGEEGARTTLLKLCGFSEHRAQEGDCDGE